MYKRQDHFSAVAKRTHYYNSVPSMELGQEKYLKHRDFIEDIKRLPNFEVKTRKLQKQSNGRRIAEKLGRVNQTGYCKNCVHLAEEECKSCVGDFSMKEKGIDVMIAIDMLNLCAVENECEMCILISGDADFIPALDIIRAKGKKVASAFIFHGYSAELRQKHEFFCMDMDHLKDKCARS